MRIYTQKYIQGQSQYNSEYSLMQQEYIRGISAWNFNLEDLKNQAALVCTYCPFT